MLFLYKVTFGTHTSHNEMSDFLAAFIDARWKWAKGKASELHLDRTGQTLKEGPIIFKKAAKIMDEDFPEILSVLKKSINQHSNIEGKNVNALFGNPVELKVYNKKQKALKVQQFFKEEDLDLDIKIDNNE